MKGEVLVGGGGKTGGGSGQGGQPHHGRERQGAMAVAMHRVFFGTYSGICYSGPSMKGSKSP